MLPLVHQSLTNAVRHLVHIDTSQLSAGLVAAAFCTRRVDDSLYADVIWSMRPASSLHTVGANANVIRPTADLVADGSKG